MPSGRVSGDALCWNTTSWTSQSCQRMSPTAVVTCRLEGSRGWEWLGPVEEITQGGKSACLAGHACCFATNSFLHAPGALTVLMKLCNRFSCVFLIIFGSLCPNKVRNGRRLHKIGNSFLSEAGDATRPIQLFYEGYCAGSKAVDRPSTCQLSEHVSFPFYPFCTLGVPTRSDWEG